MSPRLPSLWTQNGKRLRCQIDIKRKKNSKQHQCLKEGVGRKAQNSEARTPAEEDVRGRRPGPSTVTQLCDPGWEEAGHCAVHPFRAGIVICESSPPASQEGSDLLQFGEWPVNTIEPCQYFDLAFYSQP